MEDYIQTLGEHVYTCAIFYANGQRIIVVPSNIAKKIFLVYHMHTLAIYYDVLQ